MTDQRVTVAERPIDLALLKAVGLDRLAPEQRELAMHIAQRYDLDLMLKHLVMIEGRPYITRDGLLHVAHRSGLFDGIEATAPEVVDGYWRSTCSVYRKDMGRPFTYTGRYPTSGGNQKFAPEMAVKVAEVMSLRRAFDVAAPVAEERWDVDQAPEADPPAKPATLAEKAAAKAADVIVEAGKPYDDLGQNDPDTVPLGLDDPALFAPFPPEHPDVHTEPLSKEAIRTLLAAANITQAEAATKAAEIFPDWNPRREMTDRQRGLLWDSLR